MTDLEEVPQDAHACCWHRNNVLFTMNPPRWEEICCHCGAIEWRTMPQPAPPPGHGPFYPQRSYTYSYQSGSVTMTDASGPSIVTR